MDKLNIALMAGGNSSEREVSLGSARQVYDALDEQKYNVYLIDVNGRNWICRSDNAVNAEVDLNDFSLSGENYSIQLDYALIMIHGTPGEDGQLQGYFDMMGIPYSSCGLVSTVITFDKTLCKRTVAGMGVRVAEGITFTKETAPLPEQLTARLGLPMIIKPNASGSSCGVTKVNDSKMISQAIVAAALESSEIIAEQFIEGREMACGLFMSSDEQIVFPVTEIISKKEFFDYEAKYTPGMSEEITPAEVPSEVSEALQQLAMKAYQACGCRGLVRVDFILPAEGEPVMIEINSVPGMSAGSIIPKQAESLGLPLGELMDKVIRGTLER